MTQSAYNNPMSMNRKQRRLQEKKLKKQKGKAGKVQAKHEEVLIKNRGNDEVERLHMLGRKYMDEGDLIKATETFAQVMRLKPDHILTIEQMIIASQQLKRYDSAEVFLKALLEIAPEYTRAYGYLGKFYLAQHDEKMALKYLEEGLELFPNDSEILNGLASVYYRSGDDEKAEKYFKLAYENEKSLVNITSWINASHKVKDKDDYVFKELKKFEKNIDDTPIHNRPLFYSGLAKACNQLKDYDEAFKYHIKAAQVVRKSINYDARSHLSVMSLLTKYFSKNFFENEASQYKGSSSQEPVFIVGMPRSGSTLIEQMLDSHPDICGVGEAKFFGNYVTEQLKMPVNAKGATFPIEKAVKSAARNKTLDNLTHDYLEFLRAHDKNAKRFVDKALSSFLWVGLIALAFPNAKIIHCKRNSLDTCISGYQQVFNSYVQEYSYDLGELGLYYRGYAELMEHWHNVLPNRMLDVQYEEVVEDTEGQLRQILEHIKLPFDEKCLEFHKNQRFVFTSSAGQVNQPIYKSAMNKWAKYDKFLAPLIKNLGPYAPEESLYIIEKYKQSDIDDHFVT